MISWELCQVHTCVVAKKTLYFPYKRNRNYCGWGFSRPNIWKKCMKFNRNFQRGGGSYRISLLWGRYGYLMELHIYKIQYLNNFHFPDIFKTWHVFKSTCRLWTKHFAYNCQYFYSLTSFVGEDSEPELAMHVLEFVFLSDSGFRFPIAQWPSANCTPSDLYHLF